MDMDMNRNRNMNMNTMCLVRAFSYLPPNGSKPRVFEFTRKISLLDRSTATPSMQKYSVLACLMG